MESFNRKEIRMFIVYTKPSCPNCIQAKNLLKMKGQDFKEINLDVGQDKESGKEYFPINEFKQLYPTAKTVPQIFKVDDVMMPDGSFQLMPVGGYTDLIKYFQD